MTERFQSQLRTTPRSYSTCVLLSNSQQTPCDLTLGALGVSEEHGYTSVGVIHTVGLAMERPLLLRNPFPYPPASFQGKGSPLMLCQTGNFQPVTPFSTLACFRFLVEQLERAFVTAGGHLLVSCDFFLAIMP